MTSSPELAFAALMAATLAWIALPFMPALLELLRPRDAAPLDAVGTDSGGLTYFATSFTERMQAEGVLGATPPARLADGRNLRLHSTRTPVAATTAEQSDVFLLEDDTALPDGLRCSAECLSREDFNAGSGSNFRAVLGLRHVRLGSGTIVQRWVHAAGTLDVGAGSRLIGRATADDEIMLGADVQFDRLDAPVVRVGIRKPQHTATLPVGAFTPYTPEGALSLGAGYWRVTGDLTVPPGTALSGSVIVIGNVRIGEGARVDGDIKAHGTLTVSPRAVVTGALSARARIAIENGAHVSGPVISETEIAIGAAVAGTPGQRTTVTAPRVELRNGATVYGAVMSADGGMSTAS
ncbi:MAG: polymer-forming cytoskeletal protein [Gemmatimonadota bacterium]